LVEGKLDHRSLSQRGSSLIDQGQMGVGAPGRAGVKVGEYRAEVSFQNDFSGIPRAVSYFGHRLLIGFALVSQSGREQGKAEGQAKQKGQYLSFHGWILLTEVVNLLYRTHIWKSNGK
jgi:hypothetical protein